MNTVTYSIYGTIFLSFGQFRVTGDSEFWAILSFGQLRVPCHSEFEAILKGDSEFRAILSSGQFRVPCHSEFQAILSFGQLSNSELWGTLRSQAAQMRVG